MASPADPPDSSADRIAHYRIIRQIGRGAQGTVYLAEDTRLHRHVALKVLDPGHAIDPTRLDRFRREAEITSKLDNPGICAVYDSGQDRGVFWIAMRYVEGESLSDIISTAKEDAQSGTTSFVEILEPAGRVEPAAPDEPRNPTRSGPTTWPDVMRVVALFEKASRALHAAHEAGVIHRDIKPGNLIVASNGDPVILDFGLAQEVDAEQTTLTITGALMGTPAYMSPEQIAAQRIRLDRRTDVYSLGVSLFECLTLRRPFEAPTREGLYQAILTKEAPDLRRLNPAIPSDLRVVVATAIEKDRDRRYQTALDLAEELRRVRMREPIVAKPVGPIVRLGRWAQRNPAVAIALGGFMAAMTAALTLALLYLGQARAEADRERVRVREARLQSVTARAREATSGDPWTAVRLLREIPDGDGSRDAIQTSFDLLEPVLPRRVHHEPADGVDSAALSPDGKRVAITTDGGTVRIIDVEGRDEPITLGAARAGPLKAVYSPDGRHLIVTSEEEPEAWSWDTANPVAPDRLVGHQKGILSVAFSTDGRWVATGSKDHTARVWDLSKPGDGTALVGHERSVICLELSPDGSKLVTGSGDGTARVWDVGQAREIAVFRDHKKPVTVARFFDDRTILTGSDDNTLRVWAIDDPSTTLAMKQHTDGIAAAFALDGRRILSASEDGTIHVWDRGAESRTVTTADLLTSVVLSPDRQLVAGGFYERVPWVRAIDGGRRFVPLVGHGTFASDIAFSGSGDRMVTASWDGSVAVWDLDDIRALLRWEHPLQASSQPAPSPQSRPVGDAATQESTTMDSTTDGKLRIVRKSRDDRVVRVVAAHPSNAHHIVDSIELRGHEGPVVCAEFSADARKVVTGSSDATTRVWSLDRPETPIVLRGGKGSVTSVTFSPDARSVGACFAEETVGVWNLAEADPQARLLTWRNRTREQVTRLSFSPDGRLIMAETQQWVARIWDLARHEEAIVIRDPRGEDTSVVDFATFSSDGTVISSISGRTWLIDWPKIRRRLWSRVRGDDREQRRNLLGFEPFESDPPGVSAGR